MNKEFIVVIPARYASQRLPGKPLVDVGGKTMIEQVYIRAKQSNATRVIVATDNQEVFDRVRNFGGEVCMTSESHESGTDRLQEVVQKLGLKDDAIVVNVQGDEPLIPPSVINQVAENLTRAEKADAATLCEPIYDTESVFNENAVKVVSDKDGLALYFSRATIPWERSKFSGDKPTVTLENGINRHIGIYAYKVSLLNDFVTWPVAPIEQIEKLEQLRILYNGKRIHVEPACAVVPTGVDTQEDLNLINRMLKDGES